MEQKINQQLSQQKDAMVVGHGTEVTLHFSLSLDDGSIIDSNFDDDPATLVMGDGNLLAGFERVLHGLGEGAKQVFLITPEHAFGQPNPNNLHEIPVDQFDSEIPLELGLVVSFADAKGEEIPGVISEINETDNIVTVDFNHPLAGRDITFNVEIIRIKPLVTH